MNFEKTDIDKKDIYILGDFNINIRHNNKCIVCVITPFLQSSGSPILYNTWLKTTNTISD